MKKLFFLRISNIIALQKAIKNGVVKISTIGEIIAELRKDKGLKQQDLANLLCVTRNTISGYENNKFLPDIPNIIKLAEFFDVSTDYLLCVVRSNTSMKYLDKEYCKYDNQAILTGEAIKRFLKLPPNSRNSLIECIEFLEEKEKKRMKKTVIN